MSRAEWFRASPWLLGRRLLLPALVVWGMAGEIAVHPWQAAEAFLIVVALLMRFTWPSAALLLAVVCVDSAAAGIITVPVLAFSAGRRTPSLRRVGAVFALASAALIVKVLMEVAPATINEVPWKSGILLGTALAGGGLILPGAIGTLAGERARRSDALRERNAILERAQELTDTQARMGERARIAEEMHDLLGHRLSLISLHAGALELRTRQTAPELSDQASMMRATAKTALDELRGVLGILKVDSPADDMSGHGDDAGTRADIAALVLASQRAGVDVQLTWTGDDTAGLDSAIRRALHRVVREALTNAHKHAPRTAAQVLVERDGQRIRAEVRNRLAASGAPTASGTSMGLVGLRERVRLVGGTIRAGTDGERAEFVVSALLPVVPGTTAPPHPHLTDMAIGHAVQPGANAETDSVGRTGGDS